MEFENNSISELSLGLRNSDILKMRRLRQAKGTHILFKVQLSHTSSRIVDFPGQDHRTKEFQLLMTH